jgi:hypothetical protein
MSTTAKLSKHPLLGWLMAAARPQLLHALVSEREKAETLEHWQARNRSRMSASERYVHLILYRASNLLGIFEQLDYARLLLSRSPTPYVTKRVSIDRAGWTEYHFLVFTAALSGIIDCATLLVSSVYQLGIPERDCKLNFVLSNHWVAGSSSAGALHELNRTLSDNATRRNRYLHRGEKADFGELTDPELLQELRMVTRLTSLGGHGIEGRMLSRLWKEALREVRPRLDATIQGASQKVSDLLSAVDGPVRARHERLKK